MRTLDETDMEILSFLAEDARRPFSDIGDEVGLSGPAVSDRVKRLQEAGIINGFTIDVDRAQLRAGISVLVRFENAPSETDALRDRLRGAEGIEHLFVTADGHIWIFGRADGQHVRRWIDSLLPDETSIDYSVTLVDNFEWTPSFEGTEFALTCAECGNTVDSEGETARINDEVYQFCCSSCLNRFEDRYQRLEEGT